MFLFGIPWETDGDLLQVNWQICLRDPNSALCALRCSFVPFRQKLKKKKKELSHSSDQSN